MRRAHSGDVLAAVTLAVLAVLVWGATLHFPELDGGYPGPSLFPRIIAAGCLLSAIGLLRRVPTAGRTAAGSVSTAYRVRTAAAVVVVACFPLLPPIAGIAGTCLAVALLLAVRPVIAAALAALASALLYGIFTLLLGVPLL